MRFMAEYIKDCNGTQAALRAGYAVSTAAHTSVILLQHPEIKAYVEKVRTQAKRMLIEHARLTSQRTQEQMAALAYFDPRRLVHSDGTPKKVHELDDVAAAAIAGFDTRVEWVKHPGEKRAKRVVTTVYRLHNKIAALDLAAKVTGEFAKDNAQRRPARELTDDELEARIAAIQEAGRAAREAIEQAKG